MGEWASRETHKRQRICGHEVSGRLCYPTFITSDTHKSRSRPAVSFKGRGWYIARLHKSVSRGLEETQRRRTTSFSRSYLAAFVAPCAARLTPSILPACWLVLSLARPTPVSLERNNPHLQKSQTHPRLTIVLVTSSSSPATTFHLFPPSTVLPPQLLPTLSRITSASPQ